MKRQLHRNQIHKYLPKHVVVANKPGGVESVRSDSGIVYADRPFAITCFSKNLTRVTDGEDAIAQISKIAYDYMMSK
jgi:beta-lactamase class A